MEVNMNLREITITVFEEIVLIVIQLEFVCQTSAVVHSTVDMHFEFSHALSNWCQIKTNVTNLCNHLHLHADKNFFGEASLCKMNSLFSLLAKNCSVYAGFFLR